MQEPVDVVDQVFDTDSIKLPFRGKSNPDWNYTAPHGAGRLLSRTEAKKQLRLEEFQDTMSGVYSTTICPGTLDESPMAYKPMDEIVRLIEPTVEILYFVRPRINIKATEPEA
ncbi:MAG: RtcB family protein [Parabacteroides sp.]|nr:RtcB family protein [Parabacteroides sp.]MDY4527278.1 RtcB family protein [Parabacteroides sp.]